MKQKINLRLISIALLAILLTMISIIYVYYDLFQEQIRNDLKIEAHLLAGMGPELMPGNEELIAEDEIRITWISENGEVIFDNDVQADYMDNHMQRPEVQMALALGEGESVRESDTMKMMTYYYALRLQDNTVLRVAKEARSFFSIFMSIFPVVLIIILLVLVLCITISGYLTRQLLRPIREMAENMDGIPQQTSYKELSPFIDRIREQHDAILSSSRARQEFTANVSHELKTPITAISGYAELIENRMVDEEQQVKFAGAIHRNAEQLVTLVNDIIRLSELDQSGSAPDFVKVDLYEVARERVELLQNNARSKQVRLQLTGVSCEVTANRGMMIELFDNLIQNAIRYNVQGGKVMVSVQRNGNNGVIVVSDTGIGIPKADQERVFERFYRVDKSRSRDTGGTGLGLSIVKHIVELHEGSIGIESEMGKGTAITVEL